VEKKCEREREPEMERTKAGGAGREELMGERGEKVQGGSREEEGSGAVKRILSGGRQDGKCQRVREDRRESAK
jgi:hypothetical protein